MSDPEKGLKIVKSKKCNFCDNIAVTQDSKGRGFCENCLHTARHTTLSRNGKKKVRRNDPCQCGSGKKNKKCCNK